MALACHPGLTKPLGESAVALCATTFLLLLKEKPRVEKKWLEVEDRGEAWKLPMLRGNPPFVPLRWLSRVALRPRLEWFA